MASRPCGVAIQSNRTGLQRNNAKQKKAVLF
jgi:hypothetical protein